MIKRWRFTSELSSFHPTVVHRNLIKYVCVYVDSAYFDASSSDHIIPTVWLPLLDVNIDNGTLQVSTDFHLVNLSLFDQSLLKKTLVKRSKHHLSVSF